MTLVDPDKRPTWERVLDIFNPNVGSPDDVRRRRMKEAMASSINPPRRPMDERIPDGRSVYDLINKRPAAGPAGVLPASVRDTPKPNPILPQPNPVPDSPVGNLASTYFPTPAEPNTVSPEPAPTFEAPKQPSAGVLAGLTGTERLRALRERMMAADPTSKVRVRGDEIEETPPEMKGVNQRSRWKTLGEGLLLGLASADPDKPLQGLGMGLGGGISGAVSPRRQAKAMRRFQLERLDNDIARGLEIEGKQAEIDRIRNPMGQVSTRVVGEGEYPGIEAGTEIRIRVKPDGSVTDVVGPNNKPVVSRSAERNERAPHYESDDQGYLIQIRDGTAERVLNKDGTPVKVKSKNSDGEVVEVEVNGRTLKVTPGQALSYYGQTGERETKRREESDERRIKRQAAEAELRQLTKDEENAGVEKNKAYEYAGKLKEALKKKEAGVDAADVNEAVKAAEAADALYKSFAEKKTKAQQRIDENADRPQSASSSEAADPLKGKKWSKSRYKGSKPVEQAAAEAAARGAIVVP